ncbi:Rap30/74 interaction domain-containing protein [Aspergillus taichungensis]|uniref:Transcription initiation factor IIF subunit alpha n=1 Tax=Aspergillus taichungensis TaxID=482145 RepID=A0A2J5HEL6_9EURO|nr:Rap30/74 interaction domain-containing protein [Aspergillus taichungensis]
MSTTTPDANVRTPTGSNGAPPLRIRRPKAADPLVRPKKRVTKAAGPASARSGLAMKSLPPRPAGVNHSLGSQNEKGRQTPSGDLYTNGFSGPLLSESYVDYPLVTTKRALREGLKHHIAKFASKKTIDPRDESQFTRPVRLQRRDPRARFQATNDEKAQGIQKTPSDSNNQVDDAERDDLEARKAAREKERAENLAQIAPSAGSAPKKSNAPKQKTQQVSKTDMSPEEIAKTRIKYEEALPWHLEDFDNKNVWVGNYEAALSETHAVFILENTGKMRMIPVEKWYRFNAKNQFKALTIEEAEKFMAKKVKDPRWFMEKQQEMAQRKELEQFAKQRKVYAGKQGAASGVEGLEGDEMDFEEDRFADDEEHDDLFNEDEDAKAAEKRIKQDQLKANVFDLKDEKEYEEEEMKEKKEKEARRVLGKGVRKALQRREKNYDYSSGSDVNPYTDEESSEDSETEKLKEEERKAEEEKNKKELAASSKGNSTPSSRHKHTDSFKKNAAAANRKRLGSPNISDASGTDTSRKKGKGKPSTSQQSISRPMSPTVSSPGAVGKKRVRNVPTGGAGSGSEADAGAGSGGEMSESGKTKKIKLNPPSTTPRTATPQGSRAGSPAPLAGRSFSGSRASSPESNRGPTRLSTPGVSGQAFPTPAEIHAAIPQSGIMSSDLLKIFRPRIGDSKENHRRFIAIVKDVGVYGKEDRLLRPGSLKEG